MITAPIPANENERLAALRCYGILDSKAYACMEPLTKLAADICDAPISTITLIDENREWYYTKVGLGKNEIEAPRNISFCAHVVFHRQTMVISDTLKDERFYDNPFTLNDPPLRFYAGIPLINKDGYALGTLCVIDHIPKEITPKQISHLETLRDIVVKRLDNYNNSSTFKPDLDENKNELYNSFFNTDILGIVMFDINGRFIDQNERFKKMWGIYDELLIENNPTSIKEHLKSQVALPDKYINHSGENTRDINIEVIDILHMKNGMVLERHDYPFINDNKTFTRVCLFRDITDNHNLTKKLSYQATHDLLTGLVNRSEFERRLDRILSEIEHENVEHVMCYMDLDNFKHINDIYGHAQGDYLLQEISKLLELHTRKRDTLARIGGDEFGLLMENCTIKQAKRVANNLISALEKAEIDIDDYKPDIGISIGMISIDDTFKDKIELVKKADEACYKAKNAGRNCIHIE